MIKLLPLLALCLTAYSVKAQQATIPADQPYGKIDQADLEMKSCEFEKDANAEILINKAELYYDQNFNIITQIHTRIKIFNDKGKDAANIRILYYSFNHLEYITGMQGETVNLVDGKPQVTKLDKKQILSQKIDKYMSSLVFSMPDIKPGSILDYKYTLAQNSWSNIPVWYFQNIQNPVRYSELYTHIPEYFYFAKKTHSLMPFAVNSTTQESGTIGAGSNLINYTIEAHKLAMVNLPSLPQEPYMQSGRDNLEAITFHLTSFKPPAGFVNYVSDTWSKVGGDLANDDDFGTQLRRKLTNEDAIIAAAKALKTDDEKIAFLFDTVRNSMKWNGQDEWYTINGTSEAWNKKTGNSTEINLILYHLLKKSGVAVFPMVVSTRDNGRVNIAYTSLSQFNRAVVYIPLDSAKTYILDASGKYNMYNEIPYEILNSDGLLLNMEQNSFKLLFIQNEISVRRSVYINAEIKPDGKLEGIAEISNYSYNRINEITHYKTDGEKKYIDYLRDGDNNLKIASIKMENIDVDTLPLIQNIKFNLDLAGSDDNYIYLMPNLFTSLRKNPFLNENRHTDIDFGYLDYLALNGNYKIPAGYKVDAMPRNVTVAMPDNSIIFRRLVVEQDGNIVLRYTLTYGKRVYHKENYPDFHEFYKQLYEKLNEQIVLKKI